MIKINLAPSRKAVSSSQAASLASVGGEEIPAVRAAAIKKILILFLGPILLLVWEETNIPSIMSDIRKAESELAELTDKNNKAKEAVAEIKKFKKEQENLQAQITAIESLKKDRHREVKILDFIQKDMPERMWLLRVALEDGRISIQGLATTDNELTQFMEMLSKSAFLKEVNLVRSNDFNSPEFGQVKRFEISCLVDKLL